MWPLASSESIPAKAEIRRSRGRRIALTPHQVVIMDLRSGQGLLDLEAEMSKRLRTWKFVY